MSGRATRVTVNESLLRADMAQTKKVAVRNAILISAQRLFMEKGYVNTALTDIAAEAGVTVSNIYNYFGSKLDVFFAIYDPWLEERLERLDCDIDVIDDPREQLKKVVITILRDIPMDDNGFSNNVLQAISTRNAEEAYSRDLLLRSEAKVSAIIRRIIPHSRRWIADNDLISHLLFMAFDGFAVNYKLSGPSRRVEVIANMLCDLIMGEAGRNRKAASTRAAE